MARPTRASCWLLLLLLAAACSRDFSAFRFDRDGGQTRIDPSQASEGGPADAGPRDASDDAQVITAGQSGGGVVTAGGGGTGMPTRPDGATHEDDAGAEDAGVDEPDLAPQCQADWNRDLGVEASCRDCACQRCAEPVLGCAALEREQDRQLCNEVFACAMRNRCQDYTCYCTSTLCNFPEDVGDGPCAALVNQAAGGPRSRVLTLRSAETPDLTNPMIRASQAIACVLGVHASSPGPTQPGSCTAECARIE